MPLDAGTAKRVQVSDTIDSGPGGQIVPAFRLRLALGRLTRSAHSRVSVRALAGRVEDRLVEARTGWQADTLNEAAGMLERRWNSHIKRFS